LDSTVLGGMMKAYNDKRVFIEYARIQRL
jgi:hypothetical protein